MSGLASPLMPVIDLRPPVEIKVTMEGGGNGHRGHIRSGPLKAAILWLDRALDRAWGKAIERKNVFIHGDFTYWGFIKNNVHLFLALGIFGALTGYLNTFIEREAPLRTYAGRLGLNQTPLSVVYSAVRGQGPLSTPFPQADLVLGITTSLILFILMALAILWAAIDHREKEVVPGGSSEFSLLMRVSFVSLFGTLMLVFFSYMVRNYGLLFQAFLEVFSSFVAIYIISFVVKRSRDPWPWLAAFIIPGAIVCIFRINVPVLSIFSLSLGAISLAIAILMVPFITMKKLIAHLKEKHLD